MFNLGQSYSNYQDDRGEIMYFSKDYSCEEDYIKLINKKINGLRYVKFDKENMLESYKVLDVLDLEEVYCNDDWYVIGYLNGDVEIFNNSLDKVTPENAEIYYEMGFFWPGAPREPGAGHCHDRTALFRAAQGFP